MRLVLACLAASLFGCARKAEPVKFTVDHRIEEERQRLTVTYRFENTGQDNFVLALLPYSVRPIQEDESSNTLDGDEVRYVTQDDVHLLPAGGTFTYDDLAYSESFFAGQREFGPIVFVYYGTRFETDGFTLPAGYRFFEGQLKSTRFAIPKSR